MKIVNELTRSPAHPMEGVSWQWNMVLESESIYSMAKGKAWRAVWPLFGNAHVMKLLIFIEMGIGYED